MAPVKVYLHWASSPCRAVAMTCAAAGIDAEYEFVDLFKGEHKAEAFLKINPEHTVPTITDDGFNLWESRPIGIYLVDKFAPGHDLFPKDLQKRANIHRMLDFDATVYSPMLEYMRPRLFSGVDTDPAGVEAMYKRLDETVFNDKSYALGDAMTLADIYLIASVTFPEVVGLTVSGGKYPNLEAWVQRMKTSDMYVKANKEFEKFKEQMAAKK